MEDSYLDRRPKLSELQTLHTLIPLASLLWYDIGVTLQLADEDDGECLEELKAEDEEEKKKLFKVLKKWLQDSKHGNHVLQPVTWRSLLEVLKSQDLDVEKLVAYLSKDSVRLDIIGTPKTPATIIPPTTETPAAAGAGVTPLTPAAATPPTPKTPAGASAGVTPPTPNTPAAAGKTPPTPMSPPPRSIPLPASLQSPKCLPPQHIPPVVQSAPSSLPLAILDHPVLDLESVSDVLPKSSIPSTDFSLKMRDGHEVREYQKELADPGIKGKNYIIIAPTGSGKTLVAALVISDHLQKNQQRQPCHVVFVVNTKPLAEQQKGELDAIIPGARVEVYTGDNPGTVMDSIKQRNNISVCTAGKLLDEIRKGHVKFDQLSLMIFDECHHARKGHPYARLMEHYLEYKEKQKPQECLPQIIGMTASPGAGENYDLDKKKTIDHLLKLTALLDADGGFQTVTKNLAELQKTTKSSSRTRKILKPRDSNRDPFIDCVAEEMAKLEELVPKMKNSFQRWAQEYETRVQQVKQPLELVRDGSVRDDISTLNLLRCYSNALRVYMDLRQQDAVKEMESFAGFPEDDTKATPHEYDIKYRMKSLLEKLERLPPRENPLLENMMETLRDTFLEEPTSRAILFIRTKKHAYSVRDWVCEHRELQQALIKPDVITGHTRETGSGMTQVEQEEVMDRFRKGQTNLLIATSVAEEGLDVPECNLVIRFQHVSNEIAQVQTEGRARAENSQGITILSSDSRKKFRELKNMELNTLVEEILENKYFPVRQHLQKELRKIQQGIITHQRLKAAMKAKQRQSHTSDTIRLFCKKCKEFACSGSDVHMIGDDGSHHYVVPDPTFQEKITCREHPSPRDLIANEVRRTHKIHCAKCDREWGVRCIWPTNGHTFPVIKCSAFIFEFQTESVTRPLKKWSDAPFKMKPLSDWLGNNSMDDSYSSSSSDTEYNSD